MKKTILLLAVVLMALTACNKLESNEKKFLKAIQSEDYEASATGLTDFCHWLEQDKATMTHDFKLMREKLGMKVITSPDSLLRCYSWVTNSNGKESFYANVSQWQAGENFVAYTGPIDALLAGRKADFKKAATFAHSIDTIFEITTGNFPVYMIVQSHVDISGKRRAYVSACYINGVKLTLLPFFFDGTEIAGNSAIDDSTGSMPIGELFKWDDKGNKLYAYRTDDNDKILKGQYTAYELRKDRFYRLPEE